MNIAQLKTLCSLSLFFLSYFAAVSGCSEAQARGRKTMGSEIDKLENISYISGGNLADRAHLLNIYSPKDAQGKSLPLIIYVHGGAWIGRPNGSPAWVERFAKEGYAVAIVYYRLAQEGIFPSQMEDLNNALRFLKGNADKLHIDGTHFGLWGSSAGGHLVALMGTSANSAALDFSGDKTISRDVQAVCDMSGPTNLYLLGTQNYPLKQWDTSSPGAALSLLLGGTAASQKEKALQASPDTYVSAGDPPFLVIHGINDVIVPVEQSDLFVEELQKAGIDTTYMRLPGFGHDVEKGKNLDAVLAFFNKHLKGQK